MSHLANCSDIYILFNRFANSLVFDVCSAQVVIGNLVFHLGQLEYQKSTPVEDQFFVVVIAAACGGTLLATIFIIITIYKRKSTKAERQFKKLQVQLDSLESNIRHECKQGRRHQLSAILRLHTDKP